LSAAVEAAAELAPLELEAVEEVEVRCSIFTVGMEAESAPFVRGPETPLPALGFTLGYNLATALETGDLTPDDLFGGPLGSSDRWRVAELVRPVHETDLTVAAL